jgi:hypothetical protein
VDAVVTRLTGQETEGAAFTFTEQLGVVFVFPILSVMLTVYVNVPLLEGVPWIWPAGEVTKRPGGAPLSANTGDPEPGVKVSETGLMEIETPKVGKVGQLMEGAAVTSNWQVRVSEARLESRTVKVALYVPGAAVGIPVIAPVVTLNCRPAGRALVFERTYGGVPPVTVTNPL